MLENKIEPVPSSVISADQFSKTYNKVFDPLLVDRTVKNEEGKEIVVSEIRGIPLGYETMGAFYNLDLVSGSVPATWKELEEEVKKTGNASSDSDGYSDEGSSSNGSDSDKKVLVGAGLPGRYVPGTADAIALFLAQNDIESSASLTEGNAVRAAAQYYAYGASKTGTPSGVESNGNELILLKDDMDRLGITVSDLFARGKVGIVFGFPSYLREIQYAMKRASQEADLNKRNLRATVIPMNGSKKVNLARYRYFAVSKYSPDTMAGFDFLAHLTKRESQESYLEKFPYYLPASDDLIETRKDQVVDKDFPRVKYEAFLPSNDTKLIAFDRTFPIEWEGVLNVSDGTLKPARTVLSELDDTIKCQRRHLIEGANYEESCKK